MRLKAVKKILINIANTFAYYLQKIFGSFFTSNLL